MLFLFLNFIKIKIIKLYIINDVSYIYHIYLISDYTSITYDQVDTFTKSQKHETIMLL